MVSNDVNPLPASICIATNITNTNHIPSTLRYVCGKRSHGWRSARIETGCLVEGKADVTQGATRNLLCFSSSAPYRHNANKPWTATSLRSSQKRW